MYVDDHDVIKEDEMSINKVPITIGTVLTLLPLIFALIAGVGAYNSLQLQITELKVANMKDSEYLKQTLDSIKTDLRDLKDRQQQETNNVAKSR